MSTSASILLDDEEDARLLYGAASRLANATVPPVVLEGLRVGRLVALRKPNGRVAGACSRCRAAATCWAGLGATLRAAPSSSLYALPVRPEHPCRH